MTAAQIGQVAQLHGVFREQKRLGEKRGERQPFLDWLDSLEVQARMSRIVIINGYGAFDAHSVMTAVASFRR